MKTITYDETRWKLVPIEPTPDLTAYRGSDTAGDWLEDFGRENGNYMCKCCICGALFGGHKRRVVCKVCAQQDAEKVDAPTISDELLRFLHGSGEINGVWFGDKHPKYPGMFWWRALLPQPGQMGKDERQRIGQAISDFMARHEYYDASGQCSLDWCDSENVDALVEAIYAGLKP